MGEATLWAYKPWALSFELWSTNLFLQAPKYSHKKSKNGHNASIWYVLHAGCFYYAKPTDKRPVGMPEENGTTCGKGKESDPTDVSVNTSANASVDTLLTRRPTHYRPGQPRWISLLPFFINFPNSLQKWKEVLHWPSLSKVEWQILVGPVWPK